MCYTQYNICSAWLLDIRIYLVVLLRLSNSLKNAAIIKMDVHNKLELSHYQQMFHYT